LALLVRAAVFVVDGGVASVEAFEYDDLARNLLRGLGYVHHHLGTDYRAFYSGVPYVWLVAACYAVSGGSVLPVLALQSAASATLAMATFAIGTRLGGTTTGRVAAILVALHPALAFYDVHKIHSLSFDALTIAVALLALLRLRDVMGVRAAMVAGVVFGIAFLQRGTMVAMPVVAAVWLVSTRKTVPAASWLRIALAYGVGALIVVMPLVARNWIVLGTPMLTSVAAESLWRGNAPHSPGGSYLLSGQTVLDAAPAVRGAVYGRPELQQAEVFRRVALDDIVGNPAAFIGRVARKLAGFWTFAPTSGVTYPAGYLYMYATYYAGVATLAVFGAAAIVASRRHRPEAFHVLALLAATAFSVSLVQSVFYVEIRHRWGVEAFVLAVAAAGLLRVWVTLRGVTPAVAEASR
jgi:hypothetical protein